MIEWFPKKIVKNEREGDSTGEGKSEKSEEGKKGDVEIV